MNDKKSKNIVIDDCIKNNWFYDGCTLCFGRGVISGYKDTFGNVCPRCHGDGIINIRCGACDGKGIIEVSDEYRKTFSIPHEANRIFCRSCDGKGVIK